MSTIVNSLLFTQRWREASAASQSDHRFRTISREELESFERRLAKPAGYRHGEEA